jgi:hypothetical protein
MKAESTGFKSYLRESISLTARRELVSRVMVVFAYLARRAFVRGRDQLTPAPQDWSSLRAKQGFVKNSRNPSQQPLHTFPARSQR